MATTHLPTPTSAIARVEHALEAAGSHEESTGSWTCPAHDDNRASLSVTASEGRVLIHCHAGCDVGEVLAAAGLRKRDLFDAPLTNGASNDRRERMVAPPRGTRRVVATYDYLDEDRNLLYQVVRYEPKGFRQRRPDGGGGWNWTLGDVRRVPYRLPDLQLAASSLGAGRAIWIAEGEADVDALVKAGVEATCNSGGAGKWDPAFAEHLADADVTIVADRDEPGRAHARAVYESVEGVARSVRVVEAAEGKDARDHLGAGKTLDDFVEVDLADLPMRDKGPGGTVVPLRPGAAVPARTGAGYLARPEGLFRQVDADEGTLEVQLATFDAEIIEVVTDDDGSEENLHYVVEVRCEGATARVKCSPVELTKPAEWAARSGLPRAAITPGAHQHVLAATQLCSTIPVRRTVYRHLGWREIDGHDVYLHGAGALGGDGPRGGIEVDLEGPLRHYVLPDPVAGTQLTEAIRASLAVLDVAPDRITVPLLGTVMRAVLDPPPPWSLFLAGPTGKGKTTLARLATAHWGAGQLDASTTGWSSTANAIEGLTSQGANAVLLVDDWVSKGGSGAMERAQEAAERVLRTLANRDPRQRLRPDGRPRPPRVPKATAIATGESLPRGESLQARLIVCEICPGDIDLRRDVGPLAAAQGLASQGLLAASMAAYVVHLAPRREQCAWRLIELRNDGRALVERLAGHTRQPDALGEVFAAWTLWLEWAANVKAIEAAEAERLGERVKAALVEVAVVQARVTVEARPDRQFLSLLRTALGSGRAHVAHRDGTWPNEPECWGWRQDREEWRPIGERVGWLSDDEDEVWLDPSAAFAVVQRLGAETGDRLPGDVRSLARDLYDAGRLASHEMATERRRHTARRRFGGRDAPRRDVLVLAPADVLEAPEA